MELFVLLASLHLASPPSGPETQDLTPGVGIRDDHTGLSALVYENSYGHIGQMVSWNYRLDKEDDLYVYVGAANNYHEVEGNKNGVIPMVGAYYVFGNEESKVRPIVSWNWPAVVSFGLQF